MAGRKKEKKKKDDECVGTGEGINDNYDDGREIMRGKEKESGRKWKIRITKNRR